MHTLDDKRLYLPRFGSVSEGALACKFAAALSFHDVAKPVTKATCRDFSSAGSTIGETTDSMNSMLIDGLQREFAARNFSGAFTFPFCLCCQRNLLQISLLGLLVATLPSDVCRSEGESGACNPNVHSALTHTTRLFIVQV